MKKNKKDLAYYTHLDYTVRLKPYPDGSYFAEIEELRGCMTEGDTREETLAMIEDAKLTWLEGALAENIPIPEPVDDTYSGKLNVRLPKYLHRQLSYAAKQEGVSLNTYISTGLSLLLGDTAKKTYESGE